MNSKIQVAQIASSTDKPAPKGKKTRRDQERAETKRGRRQVRMQLKNTNFKDW